MKTAAAILLAASLTGCATRGLVLPEGPGEPFQGAIDAFALASADCRGVRTLTAEVSVTGTTAGGKVRGRLIAGFERPGRVRLEAVAPIGPPVFILAADGADSARTTLLLPRSREVLQGHDVEAVLDALVGLTLAPDDLQAVLAGCVVPDPRPLQGRQFAGGWVCVDLEGHASACMLQESGRWRIRAGARRGLAIEYDHAEGQPATPGVVRLQSTSGGEAGSSLRLTLSQVETNAPIADAAFVLKVPAGTASITLAELRQSGPMRERR